MRLLTALFFATAFPVAAQTTEVPTKLDFAGITLIIRDDARREIQKDVDALTVSPRHYNIKAERAKTYFPIIEKIFREERLPDDFKYLVLQESALIPDAVSTSNAVGFWQFKDFTAIEMGLRVDREIDERLNIASSSRAAARYLIKNNQFFDNWLYALQSYQMGAGGVMKSVKDTQPKATRMEITSKTYWYVKKFLAHKIAFEPGVKGLGQTQVVLFENRQRNSLNELARSMSVEEDAIRELNKWAKSGLIPSDRTYVVLLPVEKANATLAVAQEVTAVKSENAGVASVVSVPAKQPASGKVNGIHTVRAQAGDNAARLAARASVDLADFLKWNDISLREPIIEGQVYFLGRKRSRGSEAFHKVLRGETLWVISQRYGVQIKNIKKYNRMEETITPAPGTMLYLASKRPKADKVTAPVENAVEVSSSETFDWSVKTTTSAADRVKTDSQIPQIETPILAEETQVKPVDSLKILQTDKTEATLEDTTPVIAVVIPSNKEHIVKAGETLYAIANLYKVRVMDLVELNDLNLQEGIRPGQVLKLSEGDTTTIVRETENSAPVPDTREVLHEVKTSDTLYSIARQYSVTIKEIMEWNGKKDFSLSVGEKLKIMRAQ
jgi:membrane-bound lytic murein transglycosylase D